MKYFTFTEFERSSTATRYGIDNTMPESAKKNVVALVDNVLDPLREAWGKPLRVGSGYRSPELNKAVGGVAASQHMSGQAADINTGSREDNRKLFQLAIDLGLPFDQLIWEKGDNTGPDWLHISYGPRNRRKAFKL